MNDENHILELIGQALADLVHAADENKQRELEAAKYVGSAGSLHYAWLQNQLLL